MIEAGYAALLTQLRPSGDLKVMDLVAEAGVDVGPWSIKHDGQPVANPRANPNYCYEWAFGEDREPIVLCIWHESLAPHVEGIAYQGNMRARAKTLEDIVLDRKEASGTRSRAKNQAKRCDRFDFRVQRSFRNDLPLRVILLEGARADRLGHDASTVSRRLLDGCAWHVNAYDYDNGAFTILRGAPSTPVSVPKRAGGEDPESIAALPEVQGRRARIVFLNIGWMADYQGPRKNDRAKGGHGYLKEHDGHESYNFRPHHGKLLGYVPGTFDINITKFIGSKADLATDMTVVWCAMHPELKRHVIVGWYEKATIFRKLQKGSPWKIDGLPVEHQIVADAKDVYMVPRELRTFPGPDGPRIGFGRSVIYYGNEELWTAVPEFIRSRGLNQDGRNAKGKSRNGAGRQMDPEKRKQIEVAAVEHATAYYREQLQDPNCVESVEPYGLGWDLEVTLKTNEKLLVEVKGTSLPDVCAELTVNEYDKIRTPRHRNSYVIYVVTEAGTDKQCAHIFRYCGRRKKHGDIWRADDGRVLRFEERKAAKFTVKR